MALTSARLGDLGAIVGGGTPSTSVPEYWGGDVPWVTPKDLSSLRGRYVKGGERAITEDGLASSAARIIPAGSVMLSSRAPIGLVGIAAVPLSTNQGCRSFVPGPLVDAGYVYYRFLTMSEDFIARASGSTFMEIAGSALADVSFSFPTLQEQQAIAEVLGALDDKIAANAALAANALELADKLFPSDTGASSTRLGDVVSVVKGNSYKSADLAQSDHALVTLKSITRDGRYAVDGLKPFTGRHTPRQVVSPGEIVVAQTDLTQAAEVVGRAVRVPASDDYTLIASLDLAIVRPTSGIDQTYLLGLLRQARFREHCRSNTTGTTVLHLRSGAIEDFAARLAPIAVQTTYARAALPLQQVADSAAAENRILAATRDALLPQLMSGKLRVRDAVPAVEEVV
ncbi:restriction endonuclease subunit S [Microbacterium lacticum]|uniref:restriction endonuclease subunit S n=1 Tax=Microbacterium lacticum TaxID=33885 RepID=UPI001F56E3D9|nr:restriction endonuclease subunit S [Microbacterium lacticum]